MISILNIPLFSSAAPKKDPTRTQDSKTFLKESFMEKMKPHVSRISNPESTRTIQNLLKVLYAGQHKKFQTILKRSNKQQKYAVYGVEELFNPTVDFSSLKPSPTNKTQCIQCYADFINQLIDLEKCTPNLLKSILDSYIGSDLIQSIFPIDKLGIMKNILEHNQFDLYKTITHHNEAREALILFQDKVTWDSSLAPNILHLIKTSPNLTKSQQTDYLSPFIDLINSLANEDGNALINLEKITKILDSCYAKKQAWFTHVCMESPSVASSWLKAKASKLEAARENNFIYYSDYPSLVNNFDSESINEFIYYLPSYAFKEQGTSSKELKDLFTSILDNNSLLFLDYGRAHHAINRNRQWSLPVTQEYRREYPYDIQLGIQLLETRNLSQENMQLYIDLISILMKKIPKEKHYIKTTEDYDQTFSYILSSLKRNSSNPTSKAESIIKNLKETYISIIGEETK